VSGARKLSRWAHGLEIDVLLAVWAFQPRGLFLVAADTLGHDGPDRGSSGESTSPGSGQNGELSADDGRRSPTNIPVMRKQENL